LTINNYQLSIIVSASIEFGVQFKITKINSNSSVSLHGHSRFFFHSRLFWTEKRKEKRALSHSPFFFHTNKKEKQQNNKTKK